MKHPIFVADLDGDGDLDIVSWRDDTIAWYENDGADDPTFTAADISTREGAQDVHVADLDGDGDLDIVSASHDDNELPGMRMMEQQIQHLQVADIALCMELKLMLLM